MKFSVFFLAILFVLRLNAQEKTFTLSELDSITASKEIKRDSTFNDVPVYKGCKKWMTYTGKKECVNQRIADFFKENYNTTLLENSKVSPGKVSIFVTFSVDEQGNVVDGTAEGPNEHLENEALRVLKLLPKFSSPAYIKGKSVKFSYSIPIVAIVSHKNNKIVNATYPVFRGCDKKLTKEEIKKCTVKKIKNFIKLSFNYEIADRSMPLEKSTKFQVDFIINKEGEVEHVNAKANHRAIAIEAIRTAKRLPKFKAPGTIDGKAIDTPFSLLMTIYF